MRVDKYTDMRFKMVPFQTLRPSIDLCAVFLSFPFGRYCVQLDLWVDG